MLSYKKSLQLKQMGYPQPQSFNVGQWWWDDMESAFAPQMFRVSLIDADIAYVGVNHNAAGPQFQLFSEATDFVYSPSIESLMSELGDGYCLSVVPMEVNNPQRWGVWPMGAKCIEGDPCIADSIEDALADMWIQKTGRRVVILPEMPTTLDEFEDFMYVLVRVLDKLFPVVPMRTETLFHLDVNDKITELLNVVYPSCFYGGWSFVLSSSPNCDEVNWISNTGFSSEKEFTLKPKT